MRDKIKQWPINPRFLRRIANERNVKSTGDDLNEYGIFTKTSLQGFLAVVTHDYYVDNSVVLVEFTPKCLRSMLEGDELILYNEFPNLFKGEINEIDILLTESNEFRKLNPVCEYFRGINDECKTSCDKVDANVLLNALIGLTKDNYTSKVKTFVNLNKNYFDKFQIEVLEYEKNPYFKYKCEITGFIEFCFPIFFENKVIASVIVGGILPHNFNKAIVKKNIKSYCQKNIDSYKLNNLNKAICKGIDNSNRYKEFIKNEFQNQQDLEYLQKRISKIVYHISILEKRVDKRINLHRYRYVTENFRIIKSNFNRSIFSNVLGNDINVVNKLIDEALNQLNKAFPNDGFIIIFGISNFNTPELLYPIAHTGNKPMIENYYFNTDTVRDITDSYDDTFTNFDNQDLAKGLLIKGNNCLEYDSDTNILRYFKTKSSKVSFVIWKRYDSNWNFPSLENKIEKIFTVAMLEFYTSIALHYSILWGKNIESKLEDVIRVTAHELRQITPRLQDTLESNFKYISQIQFLIDENIYHHKYEDMSNYLQLLNNVVDRPSFMLKDLVLSYSKFCIVSLLRRIKSLYINQAIHKEKSIEIVTEFNPDELIIDVDYDLMMQVLYNLTDNAVKYSHRGSVIRFELEKKNKNNVRIVVVSYGPKISNDDNIYNLYYRDPNIINLEDGLGIGMFVSKKIINAHNGTLSHSSSHLSDFNIPCLYYYSRSDKKIQLISDNKLSHDIINESNKIKFKEIIAFSNKGNPRFFPVKDTFISELPRKTYLNKFYINI